MKKHVFLISLFLLFLGMTSCSSGNDGPVPTPTPQPTPTPVPSDKIDVTSKPSAAIQTAGGDATIEFTASADWSASTSADWISISPTSGTAGSAKITVKVAENTTYDERNGSVTIKSGTASQNITITQKQKDAITLTSNKVEVNAEAGEATIEVKANVDYTFEIEESAKSWISVVQTRGLSASTIRLNIAENDNLNGREGKVTITSGDLSEIVTIYQAGAKATIVISQKEYTVSSNGEDVKVELQSNCDYEIRMPNVDWISKAETRAVSTYTHYFNVAENKTYDQREASIVFVNKENNIEESVKIKQVQKDAIIVAKNEYEVEYGACNLDFDVNSNVDFKVETSVDWISHAATRALTTKPLYFNIAENKTENKREGTITISYQDIKQVIKVIQNRKSYLEIEQTNYEVAAESSVLDIAINTNSKYSVSVDSDWITEKSSTTGKHSFNISENKTYDSRTAKIQFVNEETKDIVYVTCMQKPAVFLEVKENLFEVDEYSNEIVLSIKASIDYEIKSNNDWITRIETRSLTSTDYRFRIENNYSNAHSRTGTITVSNKDYDINKTITIKQNGYFYSEQYEYNVGSERTRIDLPIHCHTLYSISSKPSWIEIAGISSISPDIIVTENTETSYRSGKVVIIDNYSRNQLTITVNQECGEILRTNVTEKTIESDGGSFSIDVTSNVNYSIDIPVSWISCDTSSSSGSKTINFTVKKNTEAERKANIVLKSSNKTVTISVTQKEYISPNNNSLGTGNEIKVPSK